MNFLDGWDNRATSEMMGLDVGVEGKEEDDGNQAEERLSPFACRPVHLTYICFCGPGSWRMGCRNA